LAVSVSNITGRDLELVGSRYAAGVSYAETVENWRIAYGLKPKLMNYICEAHEVHVLDFATAKESARANRTAAEERR
jgi:hypothetical protein